MKLKNRWVWIGGLILLAIVLLSLFAAPRATKLQQGSTYSRAPSGYGAWYAFMQQQNLPIQRWQRPLNELVKPAGAAVKGIGNWDTETRVIEETAFTQTQAEQMTLVQINDRFGWLGVFDQEWVAQGNVLVLIGVRTPVTKAPFRTSLDSPVGAVKIETARRLDLSEATAKDEPTIQALLSDSSGAVVWGRKLGKGRVIYAATPYLAANAYQDEPGNFKFLAQLVSEPGYPIYIDEYLHGYKDKQTLVKEGSKSLIGYLAKTPLLLLAIQAAVILLVLIWGQNHRLGPAKLIAEPTIDNSEAYIQALAGVLQKANCRDFVMKTIGKAEQIQIQRALGLGAAPLAPQVVIDAWEQQTGHSATELENFFNSIQKAQRLSDSELLIWLKQLQTLHRQLK